MKKKSRMCKLVLIDDFAFDADRYSDDVINEAVQAKFNAHTKPGTLVFDYKKTQKGYSYTLHRNIPYAYNGFILDLDCSFLTGEPIEKFQVNLLNPHLKPYIFVVPGSNTDGYYAPIKEFENFYKQLLGSGEGTLKPSKVKVFAGSTVVSVDVEY